MDDPILIHSLTNHIHQRELTNAYRLTFLAIPDSLQSAIHPRTRGAWFLQAIRCPKYSESPEGYEDTVKEAKCLVCHKGKKKKNRNAYGDALHELLHKKDKNDVEKIVAALETVAALSSDPETEGAPTFGELITEGKLPGGTLEELKEDPEE